MKKGLLILLFFPFIGLAQQTYVPDNNFEQALINLGYDNVLDDSVLTTNINTVDSLNVLNMNISDLTGIEGFTALTWLDCSDNLLTSLNLNTNIALTYLECRQNQLTTLEVGGATFLTWLACQDNELTTLDVNTNIALSRLDFANNQLTSLDVSANIALHILHCFGNQLTSLDVSANTVLGVLWCKNNNLTILDVSNNTYLFALNCSSNQLTNLDVSNNDSLTFLQCNNNLLTSLDVRNGKNIEFYHPAQNPFDATNNPNLYCIDVDDAAWSTVNWTVASENIDSQNYFSNNCSGTAIQEYTSNKELLKVTDLLGRETKQNNQPLLYLYDDGTVKKRIVIE